MSTAFISCRICNRREGVTFTVEHIVDSGLASRDLDRAAMEAAERKGFRRLPALVHGLPVWLCGDCGHQALRAFAVEADFGEDFQRWAATEWARRRPGARPTIADLRVMWKAAKPEERSAWLRAMAPAGKFRSSAEQVVAEMQAQEDANIFPDESRPSLTGVAVLPEGAPSDPDTTVVPEET